MALATVVTPKAFTGPVTTIDSLIPGKSNLICTILASGVQTYLWNGKEWINLPDATLRSSSGKWVGHHSAVNLPHKGLMPYWRIEGQTVVAKKKAKLDSPDPTAIAWLQLAVDHVDGSGPFKNCKLVLRASTTGGGKMPKDPPAPGAPTKLVFAYTATYHFFS